AALDDRRLLLRLGVGDTEDSGPSGRDYREVFHELKRCLGEQHTRRIRSDGEAIRSGEQRAHVPTSASGPRLNGNLAQVDQSALGQSACDEGFAGGQRAPYRLARGVGAEDGDKAFAGRVSELTTERREQPLNGGGISPARQECHRQASLLAPSRGGAGVCLGRLGLRYLACSCRRRIQGRPQLDCVGESLVRLLRQAAQGDFFEL